MFPEGGCYCRNAAIASSELDWSIVFSLSQPPTKRLRLVEGRVIELVNGKIPKNPVLETRSSYLTH